MNHLLLQVGVAHTNLRLEPAPSCLDAWIEATVSLFPTLVPVPVCMNHCKAIVRLTRRPEAVDEAGRLIVQRRCGIVQTNQTKLDLPCGQSVAEGVETLLLIRDFTPGNVS